MSVLNPFKAGRKGVKTMKEWISEKITLDTFSKEFLAKIPFNNFLQEGEI